jgi:glycosyltransferase involved in cell wall biosynthesis
MQIRLLSSHSGACLTGDQARLRHPGHLPDALSAALRERGHEVEVELLGDRLGGRELQSLREGASAGRELAERLVNGRTDGPQAGLVLHALDTVAWAAALTARSQADVAVVLRYAQSTSRSTGTAPPTEHRAHRACLRSADAIAAAGSGDRQAAVRIGVSSERAVLVPDLVGALEETSSTAMLSPGSILVSLGGIGPESGIEAALAALRWLPQRDLLVAGPGNEEDFQVLQGRVHRLDLEDRVRWLGRLDRLDTIRLIDSAALVICPSPIAGVTPAIEAMARSRAVVAMHGGRAAEVVVDGVTGLVVPVHDPNQLGRSLRALLKNPFRLEAMGLAGRERALTLFASDRTVNATEHAYQIALGAA